MMAATLFERLNESVSVVSLMERIQARPMALPDTGCLLVECPLGSHLPGKPSCLVYANRFCCVSCDAAGGVVELACRWLQMEEPQTTPQQAARWLADLYRLA